RASSMFSRSRVCREISRCSDDAARRSPPRRRRADVARRTWTLLALVLISCGMGLWIRHLAGDAHTALLIGERGADWIVRDQPFELRAKRPGNVVVWYRKRFALTAPVQDPDLVVRAFRRVDLLLDGEPIFRDSPTGADDWKRARSVALDRTLVPGPHELR